MSQVPPPRPGCMGAVAKHGTDLHHWQDVGRNVEHHRRQQQRPGARQMVEPTVMHHRVAAHAVVFRLGIVGAWRNTCTWRRHGSRSAPRRARPRARAPAPPPRFRHSATTRAASSARAVRKIVSTPRRTGGAQGDTAAMPGQHHHHPARPAGTPAPAPGEDRPSNRIAERKPAGSAPREARPSTRAAPQAGTAAARRLGQPVMMATV